MDGGLKKRHMIGGSILNALIAESKRINILLSEAGFVGTAGRKWIRRKLMNWINVKDRLPEAEKKFCCYAKQRAEAVIHIHIAVLRFMFLRNTAWGIVL